MELMKGRPDTEKGRLRKELEVYDFLDKCGIEYFRVDHVPADSSQTELCAEIESKLEAKICKNLFLANRQRTQFYLFMMDQDKIFRSSDVSKQAGSSRLHFAEPEYMEELINCTPGSASVMGLIFDREHKVRLLVDEDVANTEYVGCHPCINTSSLRIRSEDIFGTFLNNTGHEIQLIKIR